MTTDLTLAAGPVGVRPRLHVLHVMEAIGGGTARHLIDVCGAVPGRHSVVVPRTRVGAHTDPQALRALEAVGATVHIVAMRRAVASGWNALAVARVRRLIAAVVPTLVHGHSSVGGAVARLAAAGTGVPVVWTPNGLIHSRTASLIERSLSRVTDLAIAVSPSEGEAMLRSGLARPGRLRVVPNGIDPDQPPAPFDLRERLGLPPNTPVVLSIARLVPQKAPLDLVEAAAVLLRGRPDAHVVLVGDGPLAADVDAAIARHGISANVHRLRVDSGASGLLPQADAAVLTSRYEGAPYVVLEAFRAGVPVVATACVGTVDALLGGTTGIAVPVGDSAAVAHGLARLLGDQVLVVHLTTAARRALDDRFSLVAMADGMQAAYLGLLGTRSRAVG